MVVSCCCQCINIVTVVIVYNIRTFHCHILHFKLRQQLYKSQCQFVTHFIQAIMLCVDAINVMDVVNVVLYNAIALSCNSPQKGGELQQFIQKLTIAVVHKKVVIAVLQTKVINCNSANKSCLFQGMHTKGIVALTQFCHFLDLVKPFRLSQI